MFNPLLNGYGNGSGHEKGVKHDLITASSIGDLRLVQTLLQEKKVEPNATNSGGWTAVMYAAHYGHYNVIRMLVDHGCDVNLREWTSQRTALMMAASNGHTRCVETLVTHGKARVELVDGNGKNAAYYATHYGHGNNKIIARTLGIRDSRGPRPITKSAPRHQPSIVVAPPSVKKVASPLPSRASTTGPTTPLTSYSPFLSPFQFSSCFQNQAISFSTPTSAIGSEVRRANSGGKSVDPQTPKLEVGSELAQRRKRKMNISGGSLSCGDSLSPASDCSSRSPPLPSSLEQLLARIELSQYKTLFEENAIGLYQFLTMTETDLKALGGIPFGHRLQLVLAQIRFRESVEIRHPQESFLADWLLHEREQLLAENEALKELVEQLKMKALERDVEKLF